MSAREIPTTLHPNDAALNAIAEARLAAELAQTATEQLLDVARRSDFPARLEVVTLTATASVKHARGEGRSIGVLNPTAVRVFLGVGGATASVGGRSPSCPPESALVLPIHVDTPEIAADPADLAAGDLTVYVFLFQTVQALYVGGVP
jgi:hypothetical protein